MVWCQLFPPSDGILHNHGSTTAAMGAFTINDTQGRTANLKKTEWLGAIPECRKSSISGPIHVAFRASSVTLHQWFSMFAILDRLYIILI